MKNIAIAVITLILLYTIIITLPKHIEFMKGECMRPDKYDTDECHKHRDAF